MRNHFKTLAGGLAFPECPRWHEGELWLSEKRAGRVLAVSPQGAVRVVTTVPGGPGGLGWTPAGDLLVVDMANRSLLRHAGAALELVADLSALTIGRCNDMIVDAQGRAYVGHFGFDILAGAPPAPASLVLVEPDGRSRTVADDLRFPNGSAISPDGSALIVAESGRGRITRFRILPDGDLADRDTFARLDGVTPDGIALDSEGAVWVSDPVHCAVVRALPGGEITQCLSTTPMGAFACALGGSDGRTLFVCLYDEKASLLTAGAPATGSIVTTRVDVPGPPY
jgi:sugar lactone lactonase YvrE